MSKSHAPLKTFLKYTLLAFIAIEAYILFANPLVFGIYVQGLNHNVRIGHSSQFSHRLRVYNLTFSRLSAEKYQTCMCDSDQNQYSIPPFSYRDINFKFQNPSGTDCIRSLYLKVSSGKYFRTVGDKINFVVAKK